MVQGYEDGYDSIKLVNEATVLKNTNAADYNGEYNDAEVNDQGAVKSVVMDDKEAFLQRIRENLAKRSMLVPGSIDKL